LILGHFEISYNIIWCLLGSRPGNRKGLLSCCGIFSEVCCSYDGKQVRNILFLYCRSLWMSRPVCLVIRSVMQHKHWLLLFKGDVLDSWYTFIWHCLFVLLLSPFLIVFLLFFFIYVTFSNARLEEALSDCIWAQKYMRENPVIDYKQLGLRYKLYTWQVRK